MLLAFRVVEFVDCSIICYIFPTFPQGFTPLHLAASQGDLSLVKFLTQFGCSIYCKDKVCALLKIFYLFFRTGSSHLQNCFFLYITWLHSRASFLHFCMWYHRVQKGLTPEEVAIDARRDDVAMFLQQQRQDAPGQFAYRDEKCNANIWIGDQVFCGFNFYFVICLPFVCCATTGRSQLLYSFTLFLRCFCLFVFLFDFYPY